MLDVVLSGNLNLSLGKEIDPFPLVSLPVNDGAGGVVGGSRHSQDKIIRVNKEQSPQHQMKSRFLPTGQEVELTQQQLVKKLMHKEGLGKEQKQDEEHKYLQQQDNGTAHNPINHVVGGGVPKHIGEKAEDEKSEGTGCRRENAVLPLRPCSGSYFKANGDKAKHQGGGQNLHQPIALFYYHRGNERLQEARFKQGSSRGKHKDGQGNHHYQQHLPGNHNQLGYQWSYHQLLVEDTTDSLHGRVEKTAGHPENEDSHNNIKDNSTVKIQHRIHQMGNIQNLRQSSIKLVEIGQDRGTCLQNPNQNHSTHNHYWQQGKQKAKGTGRGIGQ